MELAQEVSALWNKVSLRDHENRMATHMETDIYTYACTYSSYSPVRAHAHSNTTQPTQNERSTQIWKFWCGRVNAYLYS